MVAKAPESQSSKSPEGRSDRIDVSVKISSDRKGRGRIADQGTLEDVVERLILILLLVVVVLSLHSSSHIHR